MTFRAPGRLVGSDSDFGRWAGRVGEEFFCIGEGPSPTRRAPYPIQNAVAGRVGTEGTKGGTGSESRLNVLLKARKPSKRAFQGPKRTFRGLSGPQGIRLARIRISGVGPGGGGTEGTKGGQAPKVA